MAEPWQAETDRSIAPRSTGAATPMRRQPIRVYLVDDHAVVRAGIRQVLTSAGGFEIVGEAGDGNVAVRGITGADADVAIVDVRMPGIDGIEVLRQLRARGIRTRCLVLTSFGDETSFFQCVVAGAVGFLSKGCPHEQLVDACRRAAAGENLVDRDVLDAVRMRRTMLPDDELLADLSPQERRILGLVTEGLTNGEIAEKLGLAEKTVRNYVSVVLGKIGMRNRTQAAAYVARTSVSRATSSPGASRARPTGS